MAGLIMKLFPTECFQPVIDIVSHEVQYVLEIESKSRDLEMVSNQLQRLRADMQAKVDRAKDEGMIPSNQQEVNGWLEEDVPNVIAQAHKFMSEARGLTANDSFVSRWSVKLWDRYKLAKKIEETTQSIDKIKKNKPTPEYSVLPYPTDQLMKQINTYEDWCSNGTMDDQKDKKNYFYIFLASFCAIICLNIYSVYCQHQILREQSVSIM
ncbi:putative disease resistance protein [Canna indica]|uniref:Disease resistance protein n=1 Tax=Canna indica TaxID=4628 RepID=A0AAQ3QRC1_9LILI|nr:putative disease resistance protein [Canna indica]